MTMQDLFLEGLPGDEVDRPTQRPLAMALPARRVEAAIPLRLTGNEPVGTEAYKERAQLRLHIDDLIDTPDALWKRAPVTDRKLASWIIDKVIFTRLTERVRAPEPISRECSDAFVRMAFVLDPANPVAAALRLWRDIIEVFAAATHEAKTALYGCRILISTVVILDRAGAVEAAAPHLVTGLRAMFRGFKKKPNEIDHAEWQEVRIAANNWFSAATVAARTAGVPIGQAFMLLPATIDYCTARAELYGKFARPEEGFTRMIAFRVCEVKHQEVIALATQQGGDWFAWLEDWALERKLPGAALHEFWQRSERREPIQLREAQRLLDEWKALQEMSPPASFTFRQFVKLGGTSQAALEMLCAPKEKARPAPAATTLRTPPTEPSLPIKKRERRGFIPTSSDDLDLTGITTCTAPHRVVRLVCGEVWRIGNPGAHDPNRGTRRDQVILTCLPKAKADGHTRDELVRAIDWLINSGAATLEGDRLCPRPAKRPTPDGTTISERATALKIRSTSAS